MKNKWFFYYITEDKESSEESSEESAEKVEDKKDVDDYIGYLQGYDMEKYGNEHTKFKAAEKAMQKHQHEKVTKVSAKKIMLIM